MRHLDLCSGYGSGALVFDPLGYETVAFAEVDKDASAVLAARFPGVPNVGDIKTADWSEWDGADLLTAGFPCQPASTAGQRKGVDDDRWLWPAVARAVRMARPRVVFVENVPGLLTVNDGDAFGEVLADLAEAGYVGEWACLAASDVGACHRRERVFVVAADAECGGLQRLRGPRVVAGAGRDVEGEVAQQRSGDAAGGRREVAADTDSTGRGGLAQQDGGPGWVEGWRGEGQHRHDADGLGVGVRWDHAGLALLPTPAAADGAGGRHATNLEWDGATAYRPSGAKASVSLRDVVKLLPTPTASDRWGQYAAAIARHEAVFGREAPAPLDGKRLSPRFVEWMMGLLEGWVTDLNLPRTAQLRMLGNGWVPQQARAAWGLLAASTEEAA